MQSKLGLYGHVQFRHEKVTGAKKGITKLEERAQLQFRRKKKSQTKGSQHEWSKQASVKSVRNRMIGDTFGKKQMVKDFERQTKKYDQNHDMT